MNAQDLINQIKDEPDRQITPINNKNYNILPWKNFIDLNNDSTAIDLAKQQFDQNYSWTKYKYNMDEGLANTEIRRRVIDLLKAGLNPYLAVGAFGGASTPSGGIPQNAMSAVSGENKQKIDWKTFGAQAGMNIINGIIQASISGMTMYQVQKNLIEAREDAKLNKEMKKSQKPQKSGKNPINWEMGARGLADGFVKAGDIAKAIIPSLIGIPNFNFGF